MSSISKAELLINPYLRRALAKQDALALGIKAQTAELEPTLDSMPELPTPSTKPTSREKKPSKPELQTHAEFLNWIKRLNRSLPPDRPLLAIHADPTSPSGILPGWPDFSLFHFATKSPLFIEFKRPRQGRLSPAQILIHRYLKTLGHHVALIFSSQDAISITQSHFNFPQV